MRFKRTDMASEAFSLLAVLLVGRAAHKMDDEWVWVSKQCSNYSRSADIEMDGMKLLQQQLVQRHQGNSNMIM